MTRTEEPCTVVGLGAVESELVEPHLAPGTVFVADPDDADLAAAEGAIVRADVDVDVTLLDRMPKLRVIARTGVGVDRVDVMAAKRRGIPVVITPGAGTNAVAEGTIAMALHLTKSLAASTELVRSGRWHDRTDLRLGDLEGATLGVVGYGRIGRRVAQLARVFGMRVLAFDPFAAAEPELVDLDDLRSRSDIVTLHLPLTSATHHLVDDAFIAQMPPGCLLINCGRGGLVDLDALERGLATGHLAGAGLDVFEQEPPPHHPLFERRDVVLSPHTMGLTAKATASTFAEAARGVRAVLEGRAPVATAELTAG